MHLKYPLLRNLYSTYDVTSLEGTLKVLFGVTNSNSDKNSISQNIKMPTVKYKTFK